VGPSAYIQIERSDQRFKPLHGRLILHKYKTQSSAVVTAVIGLCPLEGGSWLAGGWLTGCFSTKVDIARERTYHFKENTVITSAGGGAPHAVNHAGGDPRTYNSIGC